MTALWQDVRYALRTLASQPGFTAVIVLTLAVGIGANSAIFSVVNTVLLEPLPYADSDRLMQLGREMPIGRSDAVSASQFLFWKDNNRSFMQMASYDGQGGGINLVDGDVPERIASIRVSSSFFEVLSARAQLGRTFTEADGVEGAAKVAIISDGLWRRRFGEDASIIGRVLRLSGVDRTLVGVMEPGFDFNTHADIWTPLTLTFEAQDRSAVYYTIARLLPGITRDAAQADMDGVCERLRAEFPDTVAGRERIFVRPHLDQVVGRVRPALFVLLGAVGLVLLIACANVASLLLARSTGRRREIALRATLGAGRFRIVRQLLTESAVLAALGGVIGLLLCHWGMDLLLLFKPSNLPRLETIQVDPTVLVFTLAVTVLSVILFGLFPALQATMVDLHQSLKGDTARAGGGTHRRRVRSILVVSEIALALVLLTGAALLLDSFRRVTRLDPGYEYDKVLTMKMSFAGVQDFTTAKFTQLGNRVVERLEATPGIEAAATISTLPLEHGLMNIFNVAGSTDAQGEPTRGRAQWRLISPNYFRVMGIPLLRGRVFSEHDTADSAPVILINDALARKYFPGQDPVGQVLMSNDPGSDAPPDRIVGVVGDVREIALDRPATPTIFSPAAQAPDGVTAFVANVLPTCWVVRTGGDPLAYSSTVRHVILDVDREQPVSNIRSMGQVMSTSIARRRFNAILLTVFAVQALVLAVVGIYGVMSYSVLQRTQEIGVRMALGAQRGRVLQLVLRQGLVLTVAGVAIGLGISAATSRLLSRQLFEVTPNDPGTMVGVSLLIASVAVLSCYVPARRATKVDPMVALRHE